MENTGTTPDIVSKEAAFLSVLLYDGNIEHVRKRSTVDPAKNDPFCPVLTLSGGVTAVFLHAISNKKYVYPIEK